MVVNLVRHTHNPKEKNHVFKIHYENSGKFFNSLFF